MGEHCLVSSQVMPKRAEILKVEEIREAIAPRRNIGDRRYPGRAAHGEQHQAERQVMDGKYSQGIT